MEYGKLMPESGSTITVDGRAHALGNITWDVCRTGERTTLVKAVAYSRTTGTWLDLIPWLEEQRLTPQDAQNEAREMVDPQNLHPRLPVAVFWPTWPEYEAGRIGAEHGRNAASWWHDGNAGREHYRRTLAGIEAGDPEVMDTLPAADLSGQWADGMTPKSLCEAVGLDYGHPDTEMDETAACDAYESAFNSAAQNAVERICLAQLADDNES